MQTKHLEPCSLDRRIEELAATPSLAEPVAHLRALKGIDTLSAATICAQIGDFAAFPRAASFMAFTGLVPSEYSSGQREFRGSITKVGNAHVRRVLVEAAWAYTQRPAVGEKLRRRQVDLPPELVAFSWSTQLRLCARFKQLSATKQKNVDVTAEARELAGFVWAVMTKRYAA